MPGSRSRDSPDPHRSRSSRGSRSLDVTRVRRAWPAGLGSWRLRRLDRGPTPAGLCPTSGRARRQQRSAVRTRHDMPRGHGSARTLTLDGRASRCRTGQHLNVSVLYGIIPGALPLGRGLDLSVLAVSLAWAVSSSRALRVGPPRRWSCGRPAANGSRLRSRQLELQRLWRSVLAGVVRSVRPHHGRGSHETAKEPTASPSLSAVSARSSPVAVCAAAGEEFSPTPRNALSAARTLEYSHIWPRCQIRDFKSAFTR
jgi:hypothetical protein